MRYDTALSILRGGETIHVCYPDPAKIGDVTRYHLTGSGRNIGRRTFEKLVEGGVIEPIGDGLFGDSQTYRLRGE